jgi:hypothetical protein
MIQHRNAIATFAALFLALLSFLQLTALLLEELYFPVYTYLLTGLAILSLLLTYWLKAVEKTRNIERLFLLLHAFLRYSLAFQIGTYGAAKLLTIQFQLPEYVQDMPVGRFNGIMLTWYYFSYSKGMAWIVGLLQCAGGALLVFRRTELAGALLLLPVLINIVLINLFYDIQLAAFINSLLFTGICLYLVYLHAGWIRAALRQWYQPLPGLSAAPGKFSNGMKWMLRLLAIAGPWGLLLLLETLLAPPATTLKGVWVLQEQTVNDSIRPLVVDTVSLKRLYIQSASSAHLKKGDYFYGGAFAVNEKDHSLRLSVYASKDSLEGNYTLKDSILTINGKRNGNPVKYVFVKQGNGK